MKNSGISLLILLSTMSLITIHVRAQNSTDQTNQTTTSQKLRFVVPVRELNEFVKFRSLRDGEYNFSGFSIEVFRAAAEIAIPSLEYELVPFINPDGTMKGTFDDMLDAVHNEEFDGAVGDVTILPYRMQRVDFTIPYLESDTGLLVRVPTTYTKKESLTPASIIILVLAATLAFAILVAVVIWIWKLCLYNRSALPLTQSSRLNDNFKIATSGSTMDTRLMIILVLMVLLFAIASYMPPITPTSVPIQSLVDDIKNLDDIKRKGCEGWLSTSCLSEKSVA
ncbi:glutamate receptor 2.6 [Beta vulgaris subsp. vulgaris]|uniref:glutamate receptor 2.6 n=1 Tax=Beta vulgaris subsp. vulgaris TaxID=3555 RepID=UPI0020373071|nr:glutamate receptor 2.6 [Beta vulgaris subsp. vulgaris]